MKNLNGMLVWHVYDVEPEPYEIYGYNREMGGHYIRRQNRSLGRYVGFDRVFPMGNPQ